MTFNAPVVGLWSPPKVDAPFVCIEPWYGRCDRVGFTGEFKDRDHVSDLNPDETFSTFYTIEIEE
jgi:galactose mutarotase-like enzyme